MKLFYQLIDDSYKTLPTKYNNNISYNLTYSIN